MIKILGFQAAAIESANMSDDESVSPSYDSTVSFELETDSATLHATKNTEEGTHRIVITRKKLGDCNITGKLQNVHYGNFKDEAAALVLFKFTFGFQGRSSGVFRYREAEIKITFDSEKSTPNDRTNVTVEPVIRLMFPGRVYGYQTSEHISWKNELGVNLGSASVLPVQFGIQQKGKQERQVDRKQCMAIQAFCDGNEADGGENVAIWKLEENQADPKGIPPVFFCGAVVEHHDLRFRAVGEVKVKTGLAAGILDPRYWRMWAKPWNKDSPVIFEPGVIPRILKLDGVEGFDLSKLTEEQCRRLAPLPDEHQVLLLPLSLVLNLVRVSGGYLLLSLFPSSRFSRNRTNLSQSLGFSPR